MSTKSSFRAAFEQRDGAKAGGLGRSGFPTLRLLLSATGALDRPIDVMRSLAAHGMSLKKARSVLERLATGAPLAVELHTQASEKSVIRSLSGVGIHAAPFGTSEVDVKRIREGQGLSQPEFALLYGLDVDTLKNWEQGRNEPDGPARVLLNVIDRHPEAVLATLTRDAGES